MPQRKQNPRNTGNRPGNQSRAAPKMGSTQKSRSNSDSASKTGAAKKTQSRPNAASKTKVTRPAQPLREIALPEHIEPLIPPVEFLEKCQTLDIQFEPGELERIGTYLALLQAGNSIMNLTAVVEAEQMWQRHILDSLTLVPLLVSAEAKTIIDIGSGGGLPGIPLAIVLPDLKFALLEATGKKAAFLKIAAQRLGLKNITIISDRAESAGHDVQHREKYDAAIIRAVGHLAIVLELAIPFLRECGYAFAVKGERAAQEIEESKAALHRLHSEISQSLSTATSTIVVIEKRRRTPKSYPRAAGEPKRSPLGLKQSK